MFVFRTLVDINLSRDMYFRLSAPVLVKHLNQTVLVCIQTLVKKSIWFELN